MRVGQFRNGSILEEENGVFIINARGLKNLCFSSKEEAVERYTDMAKTRYEDNECF